MIEALGLLASFLKLALRTELERQGHSASERLLQSIDVIVEETITGFEMSGQSVFYAKHVNDGRKPGAKGVPVEALIEWIRIRKINIQGQSECSTAYMFQSSIKSKGIPASLFIDKTLRENEAVIDERITEAMGFMVDTYIEQMFRELQ